MYANLPLGARPRFVLGSLLLFVTSWLSAQERYEAGYLIREDGTRHSIDINNEDWRYNPEEILVRTGDAIVGVETTNLREFGIPGKARFVNYTVTIEKSSDEPGQLADAPPVPQQERVLLRTEVEGPATLYSYRQPQVTKYFLQLGDGTPVQLAHSQWIGDGGRVMTSSNYVTQLNSALRCGDEPLAAERTRYTLSELSRIIEVYNNCDPSESGSSGDSNGSSSSSNTYINNAAREQSLRFGITPGIYFSRFRLERDGLDRPYNEMESEVSFRIGAQVEYGLPFSNGKFAVFSEPNFYRYSSSGTYDQAAIGLETATAEYSVLEIPLGLRYYSFFSDQTKGFVNLSVGYNFFLSGDLVPDQGPSFDLGPAFSLGGGVGLQYADHYSIELRYQYDTDALDAVSLSTQTGGVRLLAGYLF